jgi:hypothetical protein
LKGDSWAGEFGMERVSHDERLIRVMGLDDDLRHAPKGVTPDDSECDRTQGAPIS